MKFNAYIVELKHRENSLTGSIITPDNTTIPVNFTKIGKDLFVANFKLQVEFKLMDKFPIKGKNKDILVLLPLLSKYNQRKLTKISKFLEVPEERKPFTIASHLISIEKFVKLEELLDFLSIAREEMIDFLIDNELQKNVKILYLSNLFVTSVAHLQTFLDDLNVIFTNCYTSRLPSIKLSEIEEKIKVPHTTLFFKYLVHRLKRQFSFTVYRDKIVFQKLGLSDTEKNSLKRIEDIMQKQKISIFTVNDILTHSDFLFKEVNDCLWYLMENNKVVQLDEKYYIYTEDLDKILNKLKKYKRNQGEIIDIQSFRDMTLLSRRFMIPLFEYFDLQKITERVENKRKILISA